MEVEAVDARSEVRKGNGGGLVCGRPSGKERTQGEGRGLERKRIHPLVAYLSWLPTSNLTQLDRTSSQRSR